MPQQTHQPKLIQSVARAVQIMEHLGSHRAPDTLTHISRQIGLSKSTTYSLIATLESLGYVYQDQESGKYSLGLKLFELGQIVHANMDLRAIARPQLSALAAQYGETVHLAVLSGGWVTYIEKVDSQHSIRIASQIGGRNPAYCTGVGKVLLAGLEEDKLDTILAEQEWKQFTAQTITDIQALKEHLQSIRAQGYALDQEEFESGLTCVAAPIVNHRGAVIAAVSLSGPSNRMDSDKLRPVIEDLQQTARRISAGFGYKG